MAETQGIVIPSGSGEVQIVMNSANAAPAEVFQTHAQTQQPPSYSYQQTTQQHPVYHQHPPQVPGYQHPSTQVPGYQHPFNSGSRTSALFNSGSGISAPFNSRSRISVPLPYQQSYLPPPQHVNTQQQLYHPRPLTKPSHDSHQPVSSQPSRVAQRPPRHDNNTPSRDESNSEKCCKDCCDKSFNEVCCKDCCGKNASLIWTRILLAIICFPIIIPFVIMYPFVIGYYLCCKDEDSYEDENCCEDCSCGKLSWGICGWIIYIIVAIICFPITILILPCLALLFCFSGSCK